MRSSLHDFWYQPTMGLLAYLLMPFAWLFGLLTFIRRQMYMRGVFKSQRFNVPVIVVGNIAVGGTGKTPFVIWLAQFLREQGLRPGIVSRGVGAKDNKQPLSITLQTSAVDAGDEPLLLAQRTGCPVVTCRDRAKAVELLLANHQCDVIISDDGLQHYSLQRDIEIAMIDGLRLHGNGCLLPAGPLRESISRLNAVDLVIVNGGNKTDSYYMTIKSDRVVAMTDVQASFDLSYLTGKKLHAVAGIGNPQRFFTLLRNQGLHVVEHVYPDHHDFQISDFVRMDDYPIIMTEKDAVKCTAFADQRFHYLRVTTDVNAACQDALLLKLKPWRSSHDNETSYANHSCGVNS